MANCWYVFHSHPYKEDLLNQQIQARGYEVFYPRVRVQPVNPRARKVSAYFPGYLFICVDLEATGITIFQRIPYGTGLVCFGGEPAVVPDALIRALRTRLSEINLAGGPLFASLKSGDEIHVHSGPFQGYDGVFDARLPGSERVRILLRMLSQSREVPVELQVGNLSKKRLPARS